MSLADTCPLCEANADAMSTDINSEHNACMFRDHCRSMEAEIAALRAEVERLRAAPTTEAAAAMGACGAEAAGVPHNESERLAFEAWVRGHRWALCAEWKDGGYRANDESYSFVNPAATEARRMWAAWRDRGALAEAVISALRAEVERLRGHLQDSIRAETSGEGLVVVKKDGFWEITMPVCMGPAVLVPNWPSTSDILRSHIPMRMPAWFVDNTMKLAERWRAAFGDGGAA